MEVVWSEVALRHLAAVYEHIAQTSPFYAEREVERIWRRSGQLRDFPDSGRAVPEYERAEIRELIQSSYRIMYRRTAERVEVLAVVHGAQRLPPLR